MDFLKVLRALLSGAYKMTDGDIDAILSASGEDQTKLVDALLSKDATRVQSIIDQAKPPAGQTFKDGEGKGRKEALTQLETMIRQEFALESEATGIELVKELLTAKAGGSKLDDESVKRHPVYLAAEKAHKQALQQTTTDWQGKLEQLESGYKKNESLRTVNSKALEILNSLQPVIPGNPKIAENYQKAFLGSLAGLDFQLNDDGSIVMIKDGKTMTDKHGHTLAFEDHIKGIAGDYFEFKANNGGSNGGNGNPDPNKNGGQGGSGGNGGSAGGAGKKFNTFAELTAYVRDTTQPIADRNAAQASWDASHPAE